MHISDSVLRILNDTELPSDFRESSLYQRELSSKFLLIYCHEDSS